MYLFEDVEANDYCLNFNVPTDAYITYKDRGNDNSIDSDVDIDTSKTEKITLISGEEDKSLDMGIYYSASVGDRVWLDENKNGIQDSDESGVKDIKVTLYLKDCKSELENTRTDDKELSIWWIIT